MKNLIIGGLLTVIMKPYIVSVDSVWELIFCLLIMWFSFWVIIEELEGLLKDYRKKWRGGNSEKKGSCKNQIRR